MRPTRSSRTETLGGASAKEDPGQILGRSVRCHEDEMGRLLSVASDLEGQRVCLGVPARGQVGTVT